MKNHNNDAFKAGEQNDFWEFQTSTLDLLERAFCKKSNVSTDNQGISLIEKDLSNDNFIIVDQNYFKSIDRQPENANFIQPDQKANDNVNIMLDLF